MACKRDFFTSKKVLHCNGDKMVPFAMYLRPIEIAVEKAKNKKVLNLMLKQIVSNCIWQLNSRERYSTKYAWQISTLC